MAARAATRGAQHRLADEAGHLKDSVLAELSASANVAQFVSFGPGPEPEPRFVRVRGLDEGLAAVEESIRGLLERSAEKRVNVRSFRPEQPKSHEFIYGLSTLGDASAAVRRLAAEGLYTIVNETIDINDGGVSGVSYGGIVEFAPEDTPRCVEKPGTASLPIGLGLIMLETIYGFRPTLDEDPSQRMEFSIHPLRRGYHHDHTIVWELERFEDAQLQAIVSWPNRFSRFIGDKAFGLLIADGIGLTVPRTTVLSRRIAPFTFGQSTGTREVWIRTAPSEQVPGKFTTRHGWVDPFQLLRDEDPAGSVIAAVLSQEGVESRYSGVAAGEAGGELKIEGVRGRGDNFMVGDEGPAQLPDLVVGDITAEYGRAADSIGAGRFEWVHDGERVWVVQLHQGALPGHGPVIYPGNASREHQFRVEQGLEALRELVVTLEGTDEGVVLVGPVGVTSHLGDVLRRARIPSRIAPEG